MAKVARFILCSVALLLVHNAGAFRTRRKQHHAHQATSLQQYGAKQESPLCAISNTVAEGVKAAVNAALNFALRDRDPLNTSFHAGRKEIDLWMCNLGLEMNASILLSGYKDARIDDLSCVESECVEYGLIGCKTSDYTFNSNVLVGDRISARANATADWNVCFVEATNRKVSMELDALRPGIAAQFVIRRSGLKFSIHKFNDLTTNLGTLDNVNCGFASLPNFIGSRLEGWCENIVRWLAGKSQTHIASGIDDLLLDLINQALDVDTTGMDAEPIEPMVPPQEDVCAFGQQVFLTSWRNVRLEDRNGKVGVHSDRGSYQKWTIVPAEGDKVFIRSHRGAHLEDRNGKVGVHGDRGSYQKWTVFPAGGNKVFIRSHRGTQLEDRNGKVGEHPDHGSYQTWTVTKMDGQLACNRPTAPSFSVRAKYAYCGNRGGSEGSNKYSKNVGTNNPSACSRYVNGTSGCGPWFSYGSGDGWCDCVPSSAGTCMVEDAESLGDYGVFVIDDA